MPFVPALALTLLLPAAAAHSAGGGAASPAPAPATEAPMTPSSLLADADKVFGARRFSDALPLYQKAAEAAAAEGDLSAQAEALSQVARTFSLTERLEEGRGWLARAAAVASPEKPSGWTRYLGVRGIFERESGDRAKALATFAEMYDFSLAHGLPRRGIDAAHHAAIVAPPADQVAWARKGIAAAEAASDEGWLAVLWNNLGATYEDLKDYPAAVEAYTKAREYHHRTGGEREKMIADWALGKALLEAGDSERAGTFLVPAREKAAERHRREPSPDTLEWVGYTERWTGELLVARGKREEGLRHLKEGRKALVEAGIERWWPEGKKDLDARIAEVEAGGTAER